MNSKNIDSGHAELDRELKAFLETLGPEINKHDRVIVGIHACIDIGITTGPEIVAALKRQGFDARHVGILLHDLAGGDPNHYRWQKDPHGLYRSWG